MKRFFISITILSLLVCMVCATILGKQKSSVNTAKKERVTIKLGFYGEGVYLKKMNEEWIPEFEKENPNIHVVTAADPDKIGFYQRLQTQFAADMTPDIARIIAEEFPALVQKGAILSIQKFINRDKAELDFKDYAPALVNAFKYKGQYYAIPTDWNSTVIFYNKDLFDKAGVAYPKDGWTWADFLAAAKKLTVDKNGDGKIDQYGFVVTDRLFLLMPWIYGAGGQLLANDMRSTLINSRAAKQGIQFFVDLATKHKVALHLAGANPANLYSGFVNGQVAMAPFQRAGMVNLKGKVNFDVTHYPKGPQKVGSVFGIGSYAIMKKAKHPEEAWKFLKWITSKETQMKVASIGSSVPTRRSVANSKEFSEYPDHANVFFDDAKYSKLIEAPPAFSEVENSINAELGLMLEGSKNVEQSTNYLKTKLDQILK
jgi:multiple sugar transport system substrate-binding protein